MSPLLIAPDGAEWSDLSHAPDAIVARELAIGRRLPDEYRAFMLSYGGGRIHPSMFVVDQPPKGWGMSGFRTFCDPLYDRDDAISL